MGGGVADGGWVACGQAPVLDLIAGASPPRCPGGAEEACRRQRGYATLGEGGRGGDRVPSTQYSVLSTQYSVLGTRYSVLGTRYSVLVPVPAGPAPPHTPSSQRPQRRGTDHES